MSETKDLKTATSIMIANIITDVAAQMQADDLDETTLADQKLDIVMSIDIKCDEAQVEDMLAFIAWSKFNNKSDVFIAGNLMHDINGIANNEIGFSPRTAGYADKNGYFSSVSISGTMMISVQIPCFSNALKLMMK
jgi:hypothetical protein